MASVAGNHDIESYTQNGEEEPFKVESSPLSDESQPATFEEAIAATNFGKFNLLLMIVIIFPCTAEIFECVALSYVLPIAQCDLGLTLEDKGILNAMTFTGMITSGLFWGYLCDSLGRRKIIIYGYFLNAFFASLVAISPNITILLFSKFFSGLIINGPFSASVSHLSEFHSSEYRARVQIVRGVLLSSASVILPLIAWGVLPRRINFSIFTVYELHSWNVFLFICTLPAIISAIAYIYIPESPKFLMSMGKNDEALKIFQTVYRINTGNSGSKYPIKGLVKETYFNESSTIKPSTKQALKEGLHQMKSLFNTGNISKITLVCFNACLLTMSVNIVSLWLPEIFQATNDYQYNNYNGTNSDICIMMEEMKSKNNISQVENCTVNLENMSVYVNSMIVGLAKVTAFGFGGIFVNIVGKKKLTILLSFASGCFSSSIYFSPNPLIMLVLYCLFLSLGSVADNILTTITIELFPTTLRTSALSLHLMFGRTGTVMGNVIYPVLLQIGCSPPIFFISSLVFGSTLLTFLYSNTDDTPLV